MNRKIKLIANNSKRSPFFSPLVFPVFGVVMSGCSMPMSTTEMSAVFSTEIAALSADTGAPIAFSDGFKAALVQAVQTSPTYRAALAEEQEAAFRVGVAESARNTQLDANGNVGSIREFGTDGTTSSGAAGGLSLSRLVSDGGESVAAINRATAEALGARAERVALANDLALEIADAWIDAWQYDARLMLLRSRTQAMDTLVGQIERMATNGMLDRAALDAARREIVGVQLDETRLQANLADAAVRFQRHFRQPPRDVGAPEEVLTPSAARAQAKAWRSAPVLEAKAATVIAARYAVEEAEAAFSPRIRFQTGVNSPLETEDPTTGSLGLGLDYSMLDGGRRENQLEAAKARRAVLEGQLRDAQIALEAEVEVALAQLAGIERSMPLVARQIVLSESESVAVRSQIATGQSNLRQLIDAEIENYRARDRQIAMQAEHQALLLTIAARTGALGQSIGLED